MNKYYEALQQNPLFKAFVDAQKGQTAVELAALKVEYAHAIEVIADQQRRIAELEPKTTRRKAKLAEEQS